jgi:lipopolysaccharide biosynthesis glycosyltransferase
MDTFKTRNIAVAFDDNYLFPFLLLAFSISKNSSRLPNIYIANVNFTLSKNSQNIAEEFCSFVGLNVKIFEAKVPKNLQTDSRISIAAYGRLWLADNLSEDFVYIDTDSLLLPGWEKIFDFLKLLDQEKKLLFAALPTVVNAPPAWSIEFGDKTHYRFHSGILVVSIKRWKKHFASKVNLPWQEIALRHDVFGSGYHDQSILQYVAQGNFLHLPKDFVNFATKYTLETKVVTSGVWKKPWTVPRDEYFKYISSLMMYQDYKQVFGVIKEIDIFANFEDQLFEHLSSETDLKARIQQIRQETLTSLTRREHIPFLISKNLYNVISYPRKLLRTTKNKLR